MSELNGGLLLLCIGMIGICVLVAIIARPIRIVVDDDSEVEEIN